MFLSHELQRSSDCLCREVETSAEEVWNVIITFFFFKAPHFYDRRVIFSGLRQRAHLEKLWILVASMKVVIIPIVLKEKGNTSIFWVSYLLELTAVITQSDSVYPKTLPNLELVWSLKEELFFQTKCIISLSLKWDWTVCFFLVTFIKDFFWIEKLLGVFLPWPQHYQSMLNRDIHLFSPCRCEVLP